MIEYYCGYPKCGKSECAEEELKRIHGKILYVGTLPDIQLYWGTIQQHKRRRPASWELYDCTGDPLLDISYLETCAPLFDGMLIDGIAYYVQRALHYYVPDDRWMLAFRRFMDNATSLPFHLYLVDQPVNLAFPEIRRIVGLIHEELYNFSEKLFYVENRTATEVNKDFLRKKDGVTHD